MANSMDAHFGGLVIGSADPGRLQVNLFVTDIESVAAHLNTLDVTWVRPVDRVEFGAIGTLRDPDGNYVQLLEAAGG